MSCRHKVIWEIALDCVCQCTVTASILKCAKKNFASECVCVSGHVGVAVLAVDVAHHHRTQIRLQGAEQLSFNI